MRALVWIVEDTWEATVAEAAAFMSADADITLLHVTSTEAETVAHAVRHGLLGRHPPPHTSREPLRAISEEAAQALLADAHTRLGRPAKTERAAGASSAKSSRPPSAWTRSSSRATATTNASARAASGPQRGSSSTTRRAEYCSSGATSHPRSQRSRRHHHAEPFHPEPLHIRRHLIELAGKDLKRPSKTCRQRALRTSDDETPRPGAKQAVPVFVSTRGRRRDGRDGSA